MLNNNQDWVTKHLGHIQSLNMRIEKLDSVRVSECKKTIQQSYDTASIVEHVAILHKENQEQKLGFKSIGLRKAIRLDDFNSPTYYWETYFSDVGRVIARGERKYLHDTIGRQVTGGRETISRSNPNFLVLDDSIRDLVKNNLGPNTLLAPIKIRFDFAKHYGARIDWSHGRPVQLNIEGCSLKVFWSHKYAQLRSFIIFNSKAGIWHVIPDQQTESTVTIALGESDESPNCVEYLVETLVRYQILDRRAFCRINLSR